MDAIDCKITKWIEYENPYEDPKDFVIATCINLDNNKPFKMRLRKSDLEWIMGIEVGKEVCNNR